MPRKPVVLITGASGEMGQGLIHFMAEHGGFNVLSLDTQTTDIKLSKLCTASVTGDILDKRLLERLVSEYEIQAIFHLAAILSTRAEFTPETAHEVNVQGTINLLQLAIQESHWHGRPVRFLFPSSIAAYGLPDLETKHRAGKVKEDEWNVPTTMYGCNKLHCEHLGRYYADYYRQLAAEPESKRVDFRSIRFPGLISAFTLPTGGTSDFASEMIHSAARGDSYRCFVREDTRIPFMAMPSAIKALFSLMSAPPESLSSHVYNIRSFSPSAGELADLVCEAFPGARVSFDSDSKRQSIVDSWPEDVDDSLARQEWGFRSQYDLASAISDYLLPNIRHRYQRSSNGG